MPDHLWALVSIILLISGIGACVLIGKYYGRDLARDALHIGVGVWPLIVPRFKSNVWPDAITGFALLGVILIPLLSSKITIIHKIKSSISGGSETWTGIAVYVTVFTFFTWLYPYFGIKVLAGMIALAAGDGIGGFVGRNLGRHHYKLPWTKPRSIEGSLGVFVFAFVGIYVVTLVLSSDLSITRMIIASAAAAITEAISPKSLDNLFIPIVVALIF